MPDKPVTVAAYAAGASLAAITLFYVFGPTYFIDGENSYNTPSGRKKGIVGLANPANDCFINSVLQALAGLGDLRTYLIRELHRRNLDGPDIYTSLPDPKDLKKGDKPEKIRDLQQGLVSQALKEMLNALNERPIYKKTISARNFIEALEKAFRTRISRTQQDAQEFLQVVAERICDEYHAGVKARKRARKLMDNTSMNQALEGVPVAEEEATLNSDLTVRVEDTLIDGADVAKLDAFKEEADEGFPLEGKLESQVECQFCHFQYKPNPTSFVTLTLHVPQESSTTLSNCFDGLLKTEYIDEFKCDKCRLEHAIETKEKKMSKAKSTDEEEELTEEVRLLRKAIEDDPETPPKNVKLPDSKHAPKRKIARHMRITVFPKVMAIHLSRSIYDPRYSSTKNAAKVTFPERLRLGGLLEEKWYKLLGVVCHKGSHNSGHYESFRRNHLYPPFSTPDAFRSYAALSRSGSATPSAKPSPRLVASRNGEPAPSPLGNSPATPTPLSTPSLSSSSLSSPSTRPSSGSLCGQQPSSNPASASRNPLRSSISRSSTKGKPTDSDASTVKTQTSTAKAPSMLEMPRFRKGKKSNDRWWRISDDKIKECKTRDVLAMQKEVYLLFYELERPGDDAI